MRTPFRKTLEWRMDRTLHKAIKEAGLDGLAFCLTDAVIAVDNSLQLRFEARSPLPEDKRWNAGLALRCVVGQTLPRLVAATRGCSLATSGGTAYEVNLGRGVPFPFFWLRSPSGEVGPLWLTSDEGAEDLYVYLSLQQYRTSDLPKQAQVLSALLPTFDSLKRTFKLS